MSDKCNFCYRVIVLNIWCLIWFRLFLGNITVSQWSSLTWIPPMFYSGNWVKDEHWNLKKLYEMLPEILMLTRNLDNLKNILPPVTMLWSHKNLLKRIWRLNVKGKGYNVLWKKEVGRWEKQQRMEGVKNKMHNLCSHLTLPGIQLNTTFINNQTHAMQAEGKISCVLLFWKFF